MIGEFMRGEIDLASLRWPPQVIGLFKTSDGSLRPSSLDGGPATCGRLHDKLW